MSSIIEDLIEKWIQAGAPISEATLDLINPLDQEAQEVKGYIPKSLKLRFKVVCATKQIKIRGVLHGLIREWVYSEAPD